MGIEHYVIETWFEPMGNDFGDVVPRDRITRYSSLSAAKKDIMVPSTYDYGEKFLAKRASQTLAAALTIDNGKLTQDVVGNLGEAAQEYFFVKEKTPVGKPYIIRCHSPRNAMGQLLRMNDPKEWIILEVIPYELKTTLDIST